MLAIVLFLKASKDDFNFKSQLRGITYEGSKFVTHTFLWSARTIKKTIPNYSCIPTILVKFKCLSKQTHALLLCMQALQLAQESDKYQKDMERIRQTNAELNIRIKEVDAENKNLEQGLKEVLKSVKESKAGQVV